MTRNLRLYWERLWRLTVSEFLLREQSTVLGFLWTLLQPLLLFSVLYGLFTRWMAPRTDGYAAYLLIGIVQYGFFNSGSTLALSSLNRRSALLLNFRVPRELVVLSAVGSVALSHLLELLLLLVFVAASGHRPQAAWLALPVVVGLNLALVAGLSLWLAVAAARYPDCERIWSILMTAGFFLTPIFYSLDAVSPRRQAVLKLNPMTHVITLTRGVLLDGRLPDPATVAGLALLCALLCGAGWAFFKRCELLLADWVAV